jgi:hypothetical protein
VRSGGSLALLILGACSAAPAEPPRDPALFWLQACVDHGYSQAETAMAIGREASEVWRLRETHAIRPRPKPEDRLLLLPYPGGRHPRLGFLEGAIDPHRDTKSSLFLPWGGYVVVDFPEAVWQGKDLVYLAHTHIPTVWDKQGVALPRLDWVRHPDGSLEERRVLPHGLEWTARVVPRKDGADFELRLKNGSAETLTGLRAQVCVLLKGAPGFNAQTRDNKLRLEKEGVCAVRSDDGRRWIATVFERPRTWDNPPCPCIHSDPSFPDLAPGAASVSRGRVFVYEGEDLAGEVARRAREGRLLPSVP